MNAEEPKEKMDKDIVDEILSIEVAQFDGQKIYGLSYTYKENVMT